MWVIICTYIYTYIHTCMHTYIHTYIHTVWCKILTGENIDKFNEFLSICQHFPHQNFPLIIFCRLHARKLSRRVLSLAIVYEPMQCFSLSMQIYINGKTVVYSYADYCVHSKQQSYAIYIAIN